MHFQNLELFLLECPVYHNIRLHALHSKPVFDWLDDPD
jgi:hypothetical protein